jgi:RNA polymerase sigma-70 factor (ECF subfamily)
MLAEEAIERGTAMTEDLPFEAFYASTAPALAAYIRRVSGDAGGAEDVLQEAYLRYLRVSHKGRGLAERRGYLYRAATTIIYDRWRRPRREEPWLERQPNLGTRPPDSALRVDMQRAFSVLGPRERALLWLAYVEGADHAEIATMLGLSKLSVRVLLFRARGKLAAILRERGIGREGVQ